MKIFKYTIYALIVTLGLAAAFVSARAQMSYLIDFTGKVTEIDGSELADGVYDMSFRLYDSAVGGALLWSEDLTAANMFSGTIDAVGTSSDGIVYSYAGASATTTLRAGQYLSKDDGSAALIVDHNGSAGTITVASSSAVWDAGDSINNRPFVEGGVINVSLGTLNDLSGVNFNQNVYLEVVFNGETMQPRKLYASAPSAFNADRLGGYSASDFGNLSLDSIISGQWQFTDILSVAASSSATALTVTQDGNGNVVEFKTGSTTAFAVLADGRIQIGNYYFPTTHGAAGHVLKTDSEGNMYWAMDFIGGFGAEGAEGLWATNTAETLIYPIDTTLSVVIGNNATSTLNNMIFEVNGSALFDVVNISSGQELRFYDNDNSHYSAIRATGTILSNFTLSLPGDAGTAGQALLTDGNGNLSWGIPSGFVYVNPGLAGQMAFYENEGSSLSGTSSVFISNFGYFGIGTTSPSSLLSVGGDLGSQFLINESGVVISGIWQGGVIGVAYGGTGTTTFEANSIVYASADNVLSQIMPGIDGYALVMQDGTPVWASTSPGSPHNLLSSMHSDTEPSALVRGDLIFGSSDSKWTRLELGSAGYVLRSDGNDVSWASTTLITALGVISAGSWQAEIISPFFGGTGRSSWQSGSIVFATSSDTIDELLIGGEGYILQSIGGKPVWSATTSLGIDFAGIGGTLGADSGGTGADSSGWNGMVQIVGGSWGAVNGVVNQVAYWSDANTISSEAQLSVGRGGTGANLSAATGFLYFDNGTAVASGTISIIRTDLVDDNTGVELSGNVLSLNTSGNWSGTFDGLEGADLFVLADWFATTSAPHIVNLANLSTIGTITVGTWNGDPITDNYISSSSYWNLAYFGRVTGADNNLSFTGNRIGVAVGYEIPTSTSTNRWQIASDEVIASSTYWNQAFLWGSHLNLYDVLGQATSTLVGHLSDYNHDNFLTSFTETDPLWNAASSSYFTLASWYATTTDGLAEGTQNLYWSDTRFDNRFNSSLLATTSISSLVELPNLSFVGVISTGTWEGDIIGVAYGGTGFGSISNQSLVYASSDNVLAEFPVGAEGEVLIVSGGRLSWASTSPASQHGLLSVTHGDTEATTTLSRGDLMVVNSNSKWARMELGASGYILYSNGLDAYWATTTSIIALGAIVQGSWMADTIAIAYGGTGATTATGARENLDLEDVYRFGINSTGTAGWLWQSDGDGRGRWVATTSLGIDSGIAQTYSRFIGTTTFLTNGDFATGTLSGYAAGNAICQHEYTESFLCRTYDILVTVEMDDIADWGTNNADAWIAQGPPGYTANSNDCNGWTTADIGYLGAFWVFNGQTGGYGKLVNCTQLKPLACCKRF